MARRIKITADENSDKLKKPNDLEQADSGISKDPEQSSAPEDTKAPEETVCKGSEISDIDNARLIKALQQYDNEMLEQFFAKSDDEPPVSISSEGRRKMKDTLAPWLGADRAELLMEREEIASHNRIKAWRHKKRVQLAKWTARWSATAAVVLLMVMSGNFIGNNAMAYRLPDVSFSTIDKNKYTKIFIEESEHLNEFESEELQYIETVYMPGKIIEGYSLLNKIENPQIMYCVYENGLGERYYFTQQVQADNIAVNTEAQVIDEIDTIYGPAQFYNYNGQSGLTWVYHNYYFKIEGEFSEDILLEIQESLQKEHENEEEFN